MRRKQDAWNLPALRRLGGELRRLENEPGARRAKWSRRRRSRYVIAPLVIAIAGGVAIVETVTPAGAESPVNKAPRRAREASTVRFASTVGVSVGGKRYARIRSFGAFDFRHARDQSTVSTPGTGEAIERRKIGRTLYLTRLGGVHSADWLAFHVSATDAQTARGIRETLAEPDVVFTVLEAASGPIVRSPGAEIDGQPTVRYSVATTLDAFLQAQYGPRYPRARENPPGTLNVWLDSHGRPLLVIAVFSGRSEVGPATLTLKIEFRQYGAPVRVAAPAASLVTLTSARQAGAAFLQPANRLVRLLFG